MKIKESLHDRVGLELWSESWINVVLSILKTYVDIDGNLLMLSENTYNQILEDLMELSESIHIAFEEDIVIDPSVLMTMHELAEEASTKRSSLQPILKSLEAQMKDFLASRGIIRNEKLSNNQKLRELELSKYDSILRDCAIELTSKEKKELSTLSKDDLLNRVSALLIKHALKR